jgi:hypothetical protein
MKALFGEGVHPNRDAMLAPSATRADTRLGSAYPRFEASSPGRIGRRMEQSDARAQRHQPTVPVEPSTTMLTYRLRHYRGFGVDATNTTSLTQ